MDKPTEKLLIRRIERWYARLCEMTLAESVPMSAVLLERKPEFPAAATAAAPWPASADASAAVGPGVVAAALADAGAPISANAGGRAIGEGDVWGETWELAYFHLSGRVPPEWAGERVVAHLDLGGEALILLPTGRCLQGISNRSVFSEEFRRDVVPLLDRCNGGEMIDLFVEATASELFGVGTKPDPSPDDPERHGRYRARIGKLRLARFDESVWAMSLDLRVLLGLVRRLPERSVRRARLIHAANEAADRFAGDRAQASHARAIIGPELYRGANASDPAVLAVGHAHIDTAWLWPVDEGIRKCARTFSTQLRLLERYPEYVFGASQAQHYQFVKDHYPELYDSIKEAVAAGRWEIQGGMWVEADCNLIDGESMVRQILHGKNFFRDEFGVEVDNLWLPDVFGYSAALPQILRRSGIDGFVTQKISWNQFNDFPHTTFRWRGIDGSEVLSHFPPENNYNSALDADSLLPGMENFREKGYLGEFLSLFGVGDGGGGPKEEQIEFGLRMRDLEGCPRVRFGAARDFLARLRAEKEKLPIWEGELYLELHRGTLTSQAAVKRGNRKCEQALRVAEMLHAALPLDRYPADQLDRMWKTLLLNQFHDILPGSSISRTYERTRAEHQEVLAASELLIEEACARLCRPDPDAFTLFQPHNAPYEGPIELPSDWAACEILDEQGSVVKSQVEEEGVVAHVRIDPLGFRTLRRKSAARTLAGRLREAVLENDLVRYEFDGNGRIRRAFDKDGGREILAGPGNALTLYEDRPNDWDAWDVDLFYEGAVIEPARARGVDFLEAGSVRQRIRFDLAIGESGILQTITLGATTRCLEFATEVRWVERHRMLRVAFPVDVRAAEATFEIQYGQVRRPTHRNTSWDYARFESVAHRYVDLSAADYGVALLNDSKYGHKVLGSTIDLNLLRAPTNPDPDADRGLHRFTYALYPHRGALADSDVPQRAASLNRPPLTFRGRAARDATSPVAVEGAGIVLAVFKKAEKGNDRILRLVETRGRSARGRIVCRSGQGSLVECDLVEWNDIGAAHDASKPLDIVLGPFEIRTYRWRGAR